MTTKKQAIANAASEAIFVYQLPTTKAIRYVTRTIKKTPFKTAKDAVNATMIAYKI